MGFKLRRQKLQLGYVWVILHFWWFGTHYKVLVLALAYQSNCYFQNELHNRIRVTPLKTSKDSHWLRLTPPSPAAWPLQISVTVYLWCLSPSTVCCTRTDTSPDSTLNWESWGLIRHSSTLISWTTAHSQVEINSYRMECLTKKPPKFLYLDSVKLSNYDKWGLDTPWHIEIYRLYVIEEHPMAHWNISCRLYIIEEHPMTHWNISCRLYIIEEHPMAHWNM